MDSAILQPTEAAEALRDSAHVSTTDSITAESSSYDNFQNTEESPMWPDILGMSLGLNLDGIAWQCEPFNLHNASTEMASGYSMDKTMEGPNAHHLTGQSRLEFDIPWGCGGGCIVPVDDERRTHYCCVRPRAYR
jgi:hypothetical protein